MTRHDEICDFAVTEAQRLMRGAKVCREHTVPTGRIDVAIFGRKMRLGIEVKDCVTPAAVEQVARYAEHFDLVLVVCSFAAQRKARRLGLWSANWIDASELPYALLAIRDGTWPEMYLPQHDAELEARDALRMFSGECLREIAVEVAVAHRLGLRSRYVRNPLRKAKPAPFAPAYRVRSLTSHFQSAGSPQQPGVADRVSLPGRGGLPVPGRAVDRASARPGDFSGGQG